MATNDPNKPDNVTFIDPGNKTPIKENTAPNQPALEGSEAPAPKMTAEEAATLAQEGGAALHDIGEEQLEPPAPFDIGGGHIPDMGEAGAAEPDKETALPAPDKKADAPENPKGAADRPKRRRPKNPPGINPSPALQKKKRRWERINPIRRRFPPRVASLSRFPTICFFGSTAFFVSFVTR